MMVILYLHKPAQTQDSLLILHVQVELTVMIQ